MLLEIKAVACFSGPQQDKQFATQMLQAKMLKFQTETSALQTAVAYTAEIKPQNTVVLTDSKAALQSLVPNTSDNSVQQLLKDLQLLPQECTMVLQWIPAQGGIPDNKSSDRLARSGSIQL